MVNDSKSTRLFTFCATILMDKIDSISSKDHPQVHPVLVEAASQLAKSVEELSEVCKTSKSVGKSPLQFDKAWAEGFMLEMSENKASADDFAAVIQKAVKTRSDINESAIPARIGKVLRKVTPIAEVALSVGEYVDGVRYQSVRLRDLANLIVA